MMLKRRKERGKALRDSLSTFFALALPSSGGFAPNTGSIRDVEGRGAAVISALPSIILTCTQETEVT